MQRPTIGASVALAVVLSTVMATTLLVPSPTGAAVPVELLPLSTSGTRIVDSEGRDVLLRGANVNSLGEYWQGDPSAPTTVPVTDEDWAAFAGRGLNVVRLLVSWSRIEPERDVIDEGYLDQVDAAVRAAADHGVYTVIDMHQDAYSAFISTPPDEAASCPEGTSPGKGWDGAPEWAVRTDGLSTCTPGERNASPAVNRAWTNFWNDVDGIRTQFVEAWEAVAARFAGRPEVAGYDLLNEPETSIPADELAPLYNDFVGDLINGVRAVEAGAGAPFEHVIFVEPAVAAGFPELGIVVPDPAAIAAPFTNVAAAAHNYAESIGGGGLDELTIEELNDLILSLTGLLGIPQWTGEYGFFDLAPETLAEARRYAADEDANLLGGAWWQWRQSCGDPHAIQWDGTAYVAQPDGISVQLNLLGCPDDEDLGPNDEFLDILGRGYPRAAPGRLSALVSDPDTGRMRVDAIAGDTDAGRRLVVWTPTKDGADHRVWTEGLADVEVADVEGGRLVSATVVAAGPYALAIGPTDPFAVGGEGGAGGAASAATATPAFTG